VIRESLSAFIRTLHRERIFTLFLAVTFLILAGAAGFCLAEARVVGPGWRCYGRGVWWAIVTLTTVGYGDIVPQTFFGRCIGVVMMLGGVLTLSLVTATVASVFIERKFRRERGLEPIKATQQVLILGWHEEGEVLLGRLFKRLPEAIPVVLVNKAPPEQMEAMKEKYPNQDIQYLWGDYSGEEVLQKANVQRALKAIILAERQAEETAAQVDQRTLLTALTLKALHPKIRILAELLRQENRAYLERAGAEETLIRGQYDGSLMAEAVASPGLFRIFINLLSGDLQSLWAVEVPSGYHGQPLEKLAAYLKETQQALVVGLYTEARVLSLEDLLSEERSPIDDFIRRKFAETRMTHLFGRTKVECQINPPGNQLLGPSQYVVVIAPQRPSLS
jgi:voltage-gated potassium channel